MSDWLTTSPLARARAPMVPSGVSDRLQGANNVMHVFVKHAPHSPNVLKGQQIV